MLWVHRPPSKLYATKKIVDTSVLFTGVLIYGMMQPFAAFTVCFSIVASASARLLTVSRYMYLHMHLTESNSSLGERCAVEMTSIQERTSSIVQLTTSNPIGESFTAPESDFVGSVAEIPTKRQSKDFDQKDQCDFLNLNCEDRIAAIQVTSTNSVLTQY